MSSRSGRGVRFLIRRYLPSELAGIATALVAGGFAYTVSDSLLVAVIAGISGENVGLSAAAGVGFLIRRRVHEARRAPIPTSTDDSILDVRVRTARVDGLRQTFADIDLDTLVMLNGTPLLVLDTERVAEQYKRLRAALPFVHWYYAVKAQSHPAVIETLALLGAALGVSSDCEIDVVAGQGVGSDRIIHTRPVKSPTEITRAYVLGIRTFVVDCAGELAKFRNVPANVSLLIRLDHRNLPAESGLQDTFGASAIEAEVLLSQAIAQGNHIAGFSFHVGSRLNSVDAFVAAMTATLDLMDRLHASGTCSSPCSTSEAGSRSDIARMSRASSRSRTRSAPCLSFAPQACASSPNPGVSSSPMRSPW